MLAIIVTINIIWIPLSILLAVIAGFAFRSSQIRKLKKQVSSLEKEMLTSHAEILNLQTEMVKFQNKSNPKSLVVAMKELPVSEEKTEEVTPIKKVK